MSPQKPNDRPERAHPAHEDTNPPEPDLGSKKWPVVGGVRLPPPPRPPSGQEVEAIRQANERPVIPRTSDEVMARQQGARRASVPESELPPPESKKSKINFTAAGQIAVLISALGGGAGIGAMFRGEGMTKEQAAQIVTSTAATTKSLDEIKGYLADKHVADDKRWDIVATILCRMNEGKPFAKKINCDDLLSIDPFPLGQTSPIKVTDAWPALPTPPKKPSNM
jgi:hypothetical protein